MKRGTVIIMIAAATCGAWAKVDLTTLPERETVQLTIYNSADLTLVRESRPLTLKEGANSLQFSWENTLIDPTSLEMVTKAHAGSIHISELVYPARVRNLGLWKIDSEVSGKVPVEITYLTSGLSWRAFYMGTLTPDEKAMRLQGYVVVTNNSGEDYENAQTRLIVGKVHILDQIAELARRQYPYGSPVQVPGPPPTSSPRRSATRSAVMGYEESMEMAVARPKEVVKEGLSEYFLYTIEGTETIPTGWSKRLPSFEADEVPVLNLYKYEEERYGRQVIRFLSFKNDAKHNLGETPIPGGVLKVYRGAGEAGHLAYEGQSGFKYIPVDEDVELNLGAASHVVVEAKLMDYATENYKFDSRWNNVAGWDDVQRHRIEVRNTRDVAVKIEIKRNFATSYWKLENSGECGEYEVEDLDTVKYTLLLEPQSKKSFEYSLRLYQGTRQEDWRK